MPSGVNQVMSPMSREQVQMIVLDMIRPFDEDNKAAIREVAEAVQKLSIAMARWSGGIAVLIVLLGFVEAITSGACGNKIKIAVDNPITQSQNKTTASEQ